MATKEEAEKSVSDVASTADFITKALKMDYPPQYLKVILEVPIKQLEKELQTLKAYENSLK